MTARAGTDIWCRHLSRFAEHCHFIC